MKRLLQTAVLVFASFFISGLAGCATTPQDPAQAVYAAHGTYASALSVAVAYKRLPTCTEPITVPVCAKPAIVAKLQRADDVAFAALTAAQNVARSPGLGANVQTAIKTATEAIAAFTSITSTLAVK